MHWICRKSHVYANVWKMKISKKPKASKQYKTFSCHYFSQDKNDLSPLVTICVDSIIFDIVLPYLNDLIVKKKLSNTNSMALSCYTFITPSIPSLSLRNHRSSKLSLRVSHINASLSSSDSKAPSSSSSPQSVPSSTPYVESKPHEPAFNYAFANTNGNPLLRMVQNTESSIERVFWLFHLLLFFLFWSSSINICYFWN